MEEQTRKKIRAGVSDTNSGEAKTQRNLAMAILSLSLLTVMAGAAVAPALNVVQQHFAGESTALVQMVVSMPALFIAITTPAFPALARRFKSRMLLLAALALYVVGGCAAGLASNIWLLLTLRALVGVSVGVIMPLSTGLLAFYFSRDRQDALMGYASAMNQMGGVVATLLSGFLATISWRASFLVYLLGLICVVLCIAFLPNERISAQDAALKQSKQEEPVRSGLSSGLLRQYGVFIAGMFFLMMLFFVYPSCFAMEIAREGVIPAGFIAPIMAGLDLVAFLGGMSFAWASKTLGNLVKFQAPVLFAVGYALLFAGGWVGALTGSTLVGLANGSGVPFIMSNASKRAGRAAATTVMPLISTALYAGQFATPFVLAAAQATLGDISRLPYLVALAAAVCLGVCNAFVRLDLPTKSAESGE